METIRCNNCGWDNPVNLTNCEKCKATLKVTNHLTGNKEPSQNNLNPMAGTRRGMQPDKPFIDEPNEIPCSTDVSDIKNLECPACGYPIRKGTKTCPSCHANIEFKKGRTVNPYNKEKEVTCFLKPKARKGEQEIPKIKLIGNSIILNRENLEQTNNTITSKIQAIVSFNEGKWYVEDKSEQKTTFKQVKGAVDLQKGDIILMGDRLFEFDCEQE
jgi:hypothetical protein